MLVVTSVYIAANKALATGGVSSVFIIKIRPSRLNRGLAKVINDKGISLRVIVIFVKP